jgi:hypothetical protein
MASVACRTLQGKVQEKYAQGCFLDWIQTSEAHRLIDDASRAKTKEEGDLVAQIKTALCTGQSPSLQRKQVSRRRALHVIDAGSYRHRYPPPIVCRAEICP